MSKVRVPASSWPIEFLSFPLPLPPGSRRHDVFAAVARLLVPVVQGSLFSVTIYSLLEREEASVETKDTPRLRRGEDNVRLRRILHYSLDAQDDTRGHLLEVPSLFHGQAKVGRRRRKS